jgi:lipopolysaccharide transport system ATP-binding protein
MSGKVVIRVENLSKHYRLGTIGGATLREDLGRWWARARGKPDPWARVDEVARDSDGSEGFWALRDVSFEVREGEVLGVIGRNGAGKSTLLKILSRITSPTSGRALIRGRVGSLLEVGTGFHPELTGRENIYLNGAILGMTRAEITRKLDEIIEFAEMAKFIDTPVKRYSSGMTVRLAFSVAAHLEPEILIVDEVLAVGDARFQERCLRRMQSVASHGRTVLFVSHVMGAVRRLCPRTIVLESGFVRCDAPTGQAIPDYLSSAGPETTAVFEPVHTKPTITRLAIDERAAAQGEINATIEFRSPFPLKSVVGGVVLKGASGEPVYGTNMRMHEAASGTASRRCGILRVEVRDLPIAPGTYSLSFWLGDWNEDYDVKEDAIVLHYRTDDTNPKRPPSVAIGHVDWPATWSLASTEGQQ